MTIKAGILIVDDDPALRKTLSAILEAKGYVPIPAATGKAALDNVKEEQPCVALIDLRLEDVPGLDLMKKIRELSPDTECIVLTGYASQASAIEAVNLGAYSYVQKPYDVDQLLVTIRRAIEKRAAEEALRKSEREKAIVLDSMSELVAYQNMDMEVLWANQAAGESVGLTPDELTGRHCYEIWHQRSEPCADCPVMRVYETGQPQGAELTTPDGRMWFVRGYPVRDATGDIVAVVEVTLEITGRKRAEERLRQQERLAVLGQLAGGIAHDFNNFLTTIMLYAQILLRSSHLPPDLTLDLDTIINESRGAARLVQQILDFSRRSIMETRPVDLSVFIHEVLDILRRTLPEDIRLLIEMGAGEYVVSADPTRIQQVLMNLVVNARDAMPEGGELHVGLSRVQVRAEQVRSGDEGPPVAEMPAGEWVCLTVSDTGIGMSPEVMAHLYEPFFTTKPVGKGTGLGLAQVYGIVRQHEGYIGVDTGVGRGTTFRVYLPAHTEVAAEAAEEDLTLPEGKGETILVVEDEEKVRQLSRQILEWLGYQVLTATDGWEALEVYGAAAEVDLVITDMIMPEMGGRELVRELKKADPDLKVLAITGYPLTEDLQELREAGIMGVVQKPFEVNTLAEAVRRVLDGAI